MRAGRGEGVGTVTGGGMVEGACCVQWAAWVTSLCTGCVVETENGVAGACPVPSEDAIALKE